ncbi:MAG: ATP-dependent DNA helicase RecG [Vicinamibacterales bacterium]
MSGAGAPPADPLALRLQYLKGVGPRKAADFAKAGLETVEDLLYRLPFRYEDRSRMRTVRSLRPGERAAVSGTITSAHLARTRRRGFTIFHAVLSDASGAIRCTWMNQAFLADILVQGLSVVMFGDVKLDSSGLHFLNAEYEVAEPDEGDGRTPLRTGRIVPFYERTGQVTPNMQRRLVREAIDRLPAVLTDRIPPDVIARAGLPPRREAFDGAHFPPNEADVDVLNRCGTPSQRRLIFDEFFLFQAGHAWRRRAVAAEQKPRPVVMSDAIRAAAARVLPFKLTPGQRVALKEIVDDMCRPEPMHRLLQGDVGSGKTIVALLAAVVAMEHGQQVAFMAPTEILAAQHFRTIATVLAHSRYRVELLTGSTPALEKRTAYASLARGSTHLVVGTHALVQEDVAFRELGLVVIDEQHRFGVAQRAMLGAKGLRPDVLLMTATPIPRTLALTDYASLDVSKIPDRPPGRTPIATLVRPESRRDEVYALVREHLLGGRQAYVVYPLVAESEKSDLKSATEMAEHLQTEVFPGFTVGLLHGRMKTDEKARVMQGFLAGRTQVLVSTTVIEVGVDVPNATVMVIEHAERFGLSQLHQLRGRVGRGTHASTCVLLYQSPWTDEARQRLQAMQETDDGFVIAERDLELRGPGDFFGTRQSGVPALRTGDLVRDRDLMELAHQEARRAVAAGPLPPALLAFVEDEWPTRFGLIEVG